MKFSALIFPAPNPPTYSGERLVGEVLYVPKDFNDCPNKYMQSKKTNEPKIEVQSLSSPGSILRDIGHKTSTTNFSTAQAKFFDHEGNLIIKDDASAMAAAVESSRISTANYSDSNCDYVPCLFLPCLKGSNKLIIFFHGNAEDLGISYEMLDHMRTALRINLMAVEYPGYGIYEDPEGASEEKIFRDAELVYNFVQCMSNVSEKDIILLGRSLGSGPTTYLAANHEPGGLILMSPYTSIKSVATGKVGFLSFLLA